MSKSLNGQYAEWLKAIRPYVDFDYNLNKKLTPAQKRLISRYYDEIVNHLMARPYVIKRFRNGDRKIAAQKLAQHRAGYPRIKVAFVPSSMGADVVLKYKKKNGKTVASATINGIDTKYARIDPEALVTDFDKTIEKAVSEVEPLSQFFIGNETFIIPATQSETVPFIKEQFRNMMMRYDYGGSQYKNALDKNGNFKFDNHYSQWLNGLVAFDDSMKIEINEEIKARQASRKTKQFRALRRKAAESRKAKKKSSKKSEGLIKPTLRKPARRKKSTRKRKTKK